MARALINVPPKARKGDVVEIKALLPHPMETGYRSNPDGSLIPRDIINRLLVTYDGHEIFSAELFPAIAANPFFAFTTVATVSGTITFRWFDDKGGAQVETAGIVVE